MPSDTYTLVIADAGVSTPADGSVTTVKIVNLAVTTAKLENYTTAGTGVTTAKLDNGAVTTVKIADGAVTAAKLETYTTAGTGVTTAKLDNGAVTTAKILNGAVTTAKLETFTNGSTGVTTDKIADLAVTSAKIAATTIVNANISATAAIGLGKLATGALPAGITVATAAACTGNAATATSLAGGSTGAIAYQTGAGVTDFLPTGNAGQILQSNGAAAPAWVTSTNTVAGGGTGITSYTAGDILYANTTTTLAKLSAAAAGNVLLSGTTPSYGKVNLTAATHVTGTLPVGNGGTGVTAASTGSGGGVVLSTSPTITSPTITSPTLTAPVLGVATATSLAATGAIKSSGTAGIGYATNAGGTIGQDTSKSNPVTLDKICGQITMNNASLAHDTVVSFVLNNTTIAAGDVLILNHLSGGSVGRYMLNAQCAAGSATINVKNANPASGALAETIVIAFVVIKAVTA